MEYKTLIIDPPWFLCTGGSKHLNPKNHYPVQKQDEIIKTVRSWLKQYPVAQEAHLYLWSINSFNAGNCRGILDALDLCEKIGFRPITLIPWIKNNGSPTPFGQRNIEVCLFGARWRKGFHKEVMYTGTQNPENVVQNLSKSIDLFYGDRREHSRKPEEFYSFVEDRSSGPYLEFYSRCNRVGWTGVGNEANKFSEDTLEIIHQKLEIIFIYWLSIENENSPNYPEDLNRENVLSWIQDNIDFSKYCNRFGLDISKHIDHIDWIRIQESNRLLDEVAFLNIIKGKTIKQVSLFGE